MYTTLGIAFDLATLAMGAGSLALLAQAAREYLARSTTGRPGPPATQEIAMAEPTPEPRWDHSVVATMLILELLTEQPDLPKYVLMAKAQHIIYTALESYERDLLGRAVTFSIN